MTTFVVLGAKGLKTMQPLAYEVNFMTPSPINVTMYAKTQSAKLQFWQVNYAITLLDAPSVKM